MRLKRLYVEITNVCNLRCPFCPPCGRPPRFMSEAEFCRVAEQAAPYKPHLYFHIKGEPLLHPLLERFLAIAEQYGLPVNLTTNGTLLPEKAGALLAAPSLRQVNVSVHSLEGRADAEAQYLAAAVDFGKAAAAQGRPTVSYRLWNAGAEGDDGRLADTLRAAFGVEKSGLGFGREAAKLAQGVFISRENRFVWPDMALPELGGRGRCLGGREMLGVFADGGVTPCCLDGKGDIILGNIFETELSELIASDRLAKMQRGFRENRLTEPLCRRCGYRVRFDR